MTSPPTAKPKKPSNVEFLNMRVPKAIGLRVKHRAQLAGMTPYEFCARVITQQCCPELEPLLDKPEARRTRDAFKVKKAAKTPPVVEKTPIVLPLPTVPREQAGAIPALEGCEHPHVCRMRTVAGTFCVQCKKLIDSPEATP